MPHIGILAPASSIKAIRSAFIDVIQDESDPASPLNITWEIFPISRRSTKEEVTVACLHQKEEEDSSSSAGPTKEIDGYLNLCNGKRGESINDDVFVSCAEVVEALDELQVPYYSGPSIKSAKYNRKDIASLAFYATEDLKGILLPCHGSVRIAKQKFYEKVQQNISNVSNTQNQSLFELSGEMVDKLRFPVVVRPINYSHRNPASKEEIICYNLKERVEAQRRLFEYGHSSVFVDELFDENDAVSVSVLCFGLWDPVNKKSFVKVMPSMDDTSKFTDADEEDLRVEQVRSFAEKLYRGIYDDATCCAPLRGHCLIRFVGVRAKNVEDEKEMKKLNADKKDGFSWVIRDIVPNCTLVDENDSSSASSSSSSDAVNILKQHRIEPGTKMFAHFFSSLVELPSSCMPPGGPMDDEDDDEESESSSLMKPPPPRFVELPFRVDYDPDHNWYGLAASRDIKKNEIVFEDEVTAFTVVTKPHVEKHWSPELKQVFSRYAWPLDSDQHLYAVWSEDPQKWRPINHHCEPNTTFDAPHSLNCIATRDIKKGEMLTLDYATFCDYTMKPFDCVCGSPKCRGLIEPTAEALALYGKNSWHRFPPKKPVVE